VLLLVERGGLGAKLFLAHTFNKNEYVFSSSDSVICHDKDSRWLRSGLGFMVEFIAVWLHCLSHSWGHE